MNKFAYFLKKFPVFRLLVFVSVILVLFLSIFLLIDLTNKSPIISHIDPYLVVDDDIVYVKGKNFGNADKDGGVHIGELFLSSSLCYSWSDTEIAFNTPKNFDSSLIDVSVNGKKSNSVMLTAKELLPVISKNDGILNLPEIVSISVGTGKIGETLTIYGTGFGNSRNTGTVFFTAESANLLSTKSPAEIDGICCLENDFDFVNWTDTKIQVKIPDAALSGNIVVTNDFGISNPVPFFVKNRIGSKKLSHKRTYRIYTRMNMSNIQGRNNNSLFISMPIPQISYRQKKIALLSFSEPPVAEKYQGANLYRYENLGVNTNISISQEFRVDTYQVETIINPVNVPIRVKLKPEVLVYTRSNSYIPSDSPEIIALSKSISGGNQNPYINAKKIFKYIIEHFKPTELSYANDENSLLDRIDEKSIDAYDVTRLFCAIARALNIPAIPIGGIVVDINQQANIHFWAEFYIDGFGWIPLDPGMAIGIPFPKDPSVDVDSFFGQLDGFHIEFSRDIPLQNKMTSDGKIVSRSKSYAIRENWEESDGLTGYTSFWSLPKIVEVR